MQLCHDSNSNNEEGEEGGGRIESVKMHKIIMIIKQVNGINLIIRLLPAQTQQM